MSIGQGTDPAVRATKVRVIDSSTVVATTTAAPGPGRFPVTVRTGAGVSPRGSAAFRYTAA